MPPVSIAAHMTHPVHTVRPLDSIGHARALMERHRVNQLPVVAGGNVVGIITDRDLRDAFPSVFVAARAAAGRRRTARDASAVPVERVMTPHVLTLTPTDVLADAARLMARERIGAIPIAHRGRLVGIVTRSDVLKAFVALVPTCSQVEAAEGW